MLLSSDTSTHTNSNTTTTTTTMNTTSNTTNSSNLDASASPSCTFVDFAPRVFQKLREAHGISEMEYRYVCAYNHVLCDSRSIGFEQFVGNLIFCNWTSLSERPSDGRYAIIYILNHSNY